MKNKISAIVASSIGLFGLVTLFMSSAIIFDLFDIRSKEGNYVLFVVFINFICSFLYLLATYGFLTKKTWTTKLLMAIASILIIGFIGLAFHIHSGGLYEAKTIGAMLFRISVTILAAIVSKYYIFRA